MITDDKEALRKYYITKEKKPYPVFLVANKYTVPTSDDDRVLIPAKRVPMIPIPMKQTQTTEEKKNDDIIIL